MARPHTMRTFRLTLADTDRGVYDDLDLRLAQHPSETDRFLIARLLVRCLEHAEGVDFGPGLSDGDTPALWRRDLRGDVTDWIEVGHPAPDRLHKASKGCGRVAVYAWRTPERLAAQIAAAKVHRAEDIELFALDPALLDRLAEALRRTHTWTVSVAGGVLYVDVGGAVHAGPLVRWRIAEE